MSFKDDNVNELFKKLEHRKLMGIRKIKLSKVITNPITVNPNITMIKVREIILKKKIKRVIVTDKKKPVGVITEKDIAKKIY